MFGLRHPLKRRGRGLLVALALGLSCIFFLGPSWAQPATPDAAACTEEQALLAETKKLLEETRVRLEQAQGAAADLAITREALQSVEANLARVVSENAACEEKSAALCQGARSFAHALSTGHVDPSGVAACIDPDDRRAIVQEMAGWTNVTKTLSRLASYSTGESDLTPQMGPSSGAAAETILTRILGSAGAPPVVFRRILVETLELLAPRSWEKRKKTPGRVSQFFLTDGPLPDDIVAEVQTLAQSGAGESREAPLTAALQLLHAYRIVASCDGPSPAPDCRRASQVDSLIQASGPLVAARRVESIWRTECESLGPQLLSSWMSELPGLDPKDPEVQAVATAVKSKVVTCFLREPDASDSLVHWLRQRLPPGDASKTEAAVRLAALSDGFEGGSAGARCVEAVRALQTLPSPESCAVPPDFQRAVRAWSQDPEETSSFGLGVCHRYARSLWQGHTATLATSFVNPPGVGDALRIAKDAPPSAVMQLRTRCEARSIGPDFSSNVVSLAKIAEALGENPKIEPWLVDTEKSLPLEDVRANKVRLDGSQFLQGWGKKHHACSLLGLDDERCLACDEAARDLRYDCRTVGNLEATFARKTRLVLGSVIALILATGATILGFRVRTARRQSGPWLKSATEHAQALGLAPHKSRARWISPSRFSWFTIHVPDQDRWARWGKTAIVSRPKEGNVLDRDVNQAGALAIRCNSNLAFIIHDDAVTPDLSAVRAALEWSAREGRKAVQVLMLSSSRYTWVKDESDLFSMTDEASLRTNPFELRGRVTTSSQFFNRERLVSGLLAGVQAGRFLVVTGLRRSGKSSLALEVIRRLPGPSAYVDLAGFHREIQADEDPKKAADAILRYMCWQLLESTRSSRGSAPPLSIPDDELDALRLSEWFRQFFEHLTQGDKASPPVLLVFDEVEHGIGAAKDLPHALEVLSILLGRLRNTLLSPPLESRERVGVLFASALHPLLWSPLATLAHQSIVGSFEYALVPCLPRDATGAMMQGLGAWHGIRFTEEALEELIAASQGLPLLTRRLGTAVLELYDTERARQGTLGAVNIGAEAVHAAIERETAEGSPSRVWIESEIADPKSPAGVLLRYLAQRDWVEKKELLHIGGEVFSRQFMDLGLASSLDGGELNRRAEEAAAVTIRMLGDGGLLEHEGDPMEPERYRLPRGMLRTVLSRA